MIMITIIILLLLLLLLLNLKEDMIVAKFRVRIRAHRLYISAAVLYQLSCEDHTFGAGHLWSLS